MNTLVNVARYHMANRLQFAVWPVSVTAFAFLVNVAILVMAATPGAGNYSGGLLALYVFWFLAGTMSLTQALPFGLALGLSRRSYYLGTVGFGVAFAAVYALGITLLQALERGTAGWGLAMHFFRVPWILDGPWYTTWLIAFVALGLAFVYGVWFGLIRRRWNLPGLLAFAAAQVTVLVAAAATITWLGAWSQVAAAFGALSALGLTGVLAAVAAALALGGFGTMRRLTV